MGEVLGILVLDGNKITLTYSEGHKEVFLKDKIKYSERSQWIEWKGERYFLKQD